MNATEVLKLARKFGLEIEDNIEFNEMGLDFQVVFVSERNGARWILRVPRRNDLMVKMNYEKNALDFLQQKLHVGIPDWKICERELIAYPLLEDPPVLTFDATTYEVEWNINREKNNLTGSLAQFLIELHTVDIKEASARGLHTLTVDQERTKTLNEICLVKQHIKIGEKPEQRWKAWLDDDGYWPEFLSVVHGDLYAGHVLAKPNGEITGVIDWSEVKIGDPSIDFAGHVNAFGTEGLGELITCYQQKGGRIWSRMAQHCVERSSIAPLKYAVFAIENDSEQHIEAARQQIAALK